MKRNWLISLLLFVTPLVFFSCSKDSSSTDLVGNWTQITEIKGVGRSGAVCFTIADSAYIGLGYNPTSNPKYLTDFYRYDYKNNKWKQIASFPIAGRVNAVSFSINKLGYVGTGYDGNDYKGDFYEYNPATNTWRRVANMGTPAGSTRRGATAFSIGNNGYVGTGYNGNYLSDFWKYTPNADSGVWTEIADIPFKRASAASFVINNIGYVVTGERDGSYVNDFWKFDPASSNWTKLRDIANTNTTESYDDNYNIIRSSAIALTANNLGYITSGNSSGYRSDTWEYNPGTDLWTQKTGFEGTARTEAVGFSLGNRIFVGTGKNGSSVWDDFWEFKPTQTYDAYN